MGKYETQIRANPLGFRDDLIAGFEGEGMLEQTSFSISLITVAKSVNRNSIGSEEDKTRSFSSESTMLFHLSTKRLMLIRESCDVSMLLSEYIESPPSREHSSTSSRLEHQN
jgi:hypothetical protein